jgi:hypothetical protein
MWGSILPGPHFGAPTTAHKWMQHEIGGERHEIKIPLIAIWSNQVVSKRSKMAAQNAESKVSVITGAGKAESHLIH